MCLLSSPIVTIEVSLSVGLRGSLTSLWVITWPWTSHWPLYVPAEPFTVRRGWSRIIVQKNKAVKWICVWSHDRSCPSTTTGGNGPRYTDRQNPAVDSSSICKIALIWLFSDSKKRMRVTHSKPRNQSQNNQKIVPFLHWESIFN